MGPFLCHSLKLFCQKYFPERWITSWTLNQKHVIKVEWNCIHDVYASTIFVLKILYYVLYVNILIEIVSKPVLWIWYFVINKLIIIYKLGPT